jgi:hypothetical protein
MNETVKLERIEYLEFEISRHHGELRINPNDWGRILAVSHLEDELKALKEDTDSEG